jgi:hydrogenase maturation protein HypF
MNVNRIARKYRVNGIVQGVGFRPFVYGLAVEHGIAGRVANTAAGVRIHAEGPAESVKRFGRDLADRKPPLAHVTAVGAEDAVDEGLTDFVIVSSEGGETATLISPDMAVCDDCLRELRDPADRRFRYPFINCTHCGPRYTIIADIPYDRPKTSMAVFPMCDRCRAEYENPLDRRFHAQPNACPECGPRVSLHRPDRSEVHCEDPIRETAALLRAGRILAIKGLGGFHLAADAENPQAVAKLRERKRREEKPFALMSPDLERIRAYAEVRPEEAALLASPQRPIVLLQKREPNAIAPAVAPGNPWIGAMLPYTPLHHLLMDEGFSALVMTSANLSEEPIAIANDEAFRRLGGIADFFLIHNRDIYLRSDDSVARRVDGETRFLRRSRGYAPRPVFLRESLPPVLACGAELKSTVCLTRDRNAFLSQHIGDLENLETFEFYRKTAGHLERILDLKPEFVVYDLHPDYLSTRYALEERDEPKVAVQHHHAHIAACLAENGETGPAIGLALDGTGYGTDGAIWGGEVLVADLAGFTRAAHIGYVPLPGGAAAIREPWRMAVAYLLETFGDEGLEKDLPLLREIGPERVGVVAQMARRGLNAPPTSSLGRLFDGVAALAGIRSTVTFEGQAAMMLEMVADSGAAEAYPFEWTQEAPRRLLTGPIIRGVVDDLIAGVPVSVVSARFHQTIMTAFAKICEYLRKETGIDRVALSGGVFQNVRLLAGMIGKLKNLDFYVMSHKEVPTNDGGIALGQAVIGAQMNR